MSTSFVGRSAPARTRYKLAPVRVPASAHVGRVVDVLPPWRRTALRFVERLELAVTAIGVVAGLGMIGLTCCTPLSTLRQREPAPPIQALQRFLPKVLAIDLKMT